ncbi:CHAT domain-containing protein [Streptomyces sp. NPDC093094]|uniref:CHAT domain-containing protein n=1 Tax=Streptomyces sp. NPDC093094 TaxID=3366026 RepID=UPI003812068E
MTSSRYRADYAASLVEQAAYLTSLGRFGEALNSSAKACRIYTDPESDGTTAEPRARAQAFTRHVIILMRLESDETEVRRWARRALPEWNAQSRPMRHGDRMLQARTMHVMSALEILTGQDSRAARTAADALDVLPRSRPSDRGPTELTLLVRLLTCYAMALAGAGHRQLAAENASEALERLTALGTAGPRDPQGAEDADRTAAGLAALSNPEQRHIPSPRMLLGGLDASLTEAAGTGTAQIAAGESILLHQHLARERNEAPGPALLEAQCRRVTQLSTRGHQEEAARALTEAIATARTLFAREALGHRRQTARLMRELGTFLLNRVGRNSVDIDRVIEVFDLVTTASWDTADPGWTVAALGLGTALLSRFEQRQDRQDLDRAISLVREVRDPRPPRPEQRHEAARLAARALRLRHDRTGDLADLDEAVANAAEAAGFDSDGHDDLEALIALLQRSLDLTDPGVPQFARALLSLACALLTRFDRDGHPGDLDRAIAVAREAAARATAEANSVRGPALELLASACNRRYARSGDGQDLDEEIDALRGLLSELPHDHTGRPESLQGLAVALQRRHERRGTLADLETALSASREAVALLPAGDARRTLAQIGLAGALRTSFLLSGDEDVLREAARTAANAVEESPESSPTRAQALVALALSLGSRAQVSGEDADLARAVSLAREATSLLPADSPSRTSALDLLADLLGPGSLDDDLADAFEALRKDVLSPNTLPLQRLRAAERLGWLALRTGSHESALESYSRAIELLPLVLLLRREYATERAETEPGDFEELVNDAAASAVAAGRPEDAVVLLERGRVTLLAHAPGPDRLAERLRTNAPDVASRLQSLAGRIADAEAGTPRPDLAAEWEELVRRIRDLPGTRSILVAPTIEELIAQADDGPLVMVNVSRYRSDALIVAPDGVRAVPLPDLHAELPDRLRQFRALLSPDYAPLAQHLKAEDPLRHTLDWLWSAVAEPVLDAIAPPVPRPGEPLPRLWWIPTGLLGLLPLHAAQDAGSRERGGDPTRSALDRVCASYAATVSALAAARRQSPPAPETGLSALVVAPADSSRVAALPHAQREAYEVLACWRDARLLTGSQATADAVRYLLRDSSVLHFAGHGVMHAGSQRVGGLELADGLLTTASLLEARPAAPQFAFVSACHTAADGAGTPWQAVGLPAALHLGGYQHVIGTLWEIDDRTHADMSALFYEGLGASGSADPKRSAWALNRAVRRMRDRYPHIPSLWAAHVHVGP